MIRATGAGEENIIEKQNAQTGYTNGNKPAAQFYHEMAQATTEKRMFRRRIGRHTTYRVSVRFSNTSRETMDEKIFRMIKNDAASGNGAGA